MNKQTIKLRAGSSVRSGPMFNPLDPPHNTAGSRGASPATCIDTAQDLR